MHLPKLPYKKLFYFVIVFLTIGITSNSFSQDKKLPDHNQHNNRTLRFGHATGENPAIIFGKYSKLLDYLSKKLKRKIVFIQQKTYEDTQEAFLNGEIDMGILNAFSYINISHSNKIIPIAARVKRNSRTYQTFIIVRRNSKIKNYKDLIGKKFAFGDPFSTSSNLMPRILLFQHGINPERDFKKTYTIKKQDSIIFAILNKTVDAGAIASFIFNEYDPRVTARLKIIARSIKFPLGPFVARRALGKKLIGEITKILLNMDKNKEGIEALHRAELDRFEVVSDSDYNPVRHMWEQYKMFVQEESTILKKKRQK